MDFNAIIIEDGKELGQEFFRDDLATAADNQKVIQFDIYEGNTEDLEACILPGSVRLDLPSNQPKGTRANYRNNIAYYSKITYIRMEFSLFLLILRHLLFSD